VVNEVTVADLECAREDVIVDAIAGGRWPHACDPSLVEHAGACEICRDVVTVAVALRDAELDARQQFNVARVPSAAIVWWRATIRARAEAARAAERPMSVAHGVAGACAVGLTFAFAGAAWESVQQAHRLGEWIASLDAGRLQFASASAVMLQRALPLVLGLGACLLIAPLAIYFVLSDD
jgi:hypothetical protein